MNESFVLEIARNGSPVPITGFHPALGLVLEGETSSWPRGLALGIRPQSPGTKELAGRIRQRKGWPEDVFLLQGPFFENGKLRYTGMGDDALPPGRWDLSVQVGGLDQESVGIQIDIPENGEAVARVQEKPEKRKITVERVQRFDDHTRRIVTNDRSELDRQPLADWLGDQGRRAARRACLLNLLAKLRSVPNARPEECLSRSVESVFFADIDRIYARVGPEFLPQVEAALPVKEGDPKAGIHRRLLDRIPAPPGGGSYRLLSFREGGENCMQVVIAVGPDGVSRFAEMDIDLGNPFWDLKGLFIHLGELLDPSRTDHLKLFTALSGTGAKDFLYYTVEKPKSGKK
jgi:hypothetical protein